MMITAKDLKRMIQGEVSRTLSERKYTVVSGDTMYGIAAAEGVSIQALLRVNSQFDAAKLSDWTRGDRPEANDRPGNSNRNPNWIFPGEEIEIPDGSGTDTGSGTGSPSAAGTGGTDPLGNPPPNFTAVAVERQISQCTRDMLAMIQRISDCIEEIRLEVEERD